MISTGSNSEDVNAEHRKADEKTTETVVNNKSTVDGNKSNVKLSTSDEYDKSTETKVIPAGKSKLSGKVRTGWI